MNFYYDLPHGHLIIEGFIVEMGKCQIFFSNVKFFVSDCHDRLQGHPCNFQGKVIRYKL